MCVGREKGKERDIESVCVWWGDREGKRVCVCVIKRERTGRVCVCVCVGVGVCMLEREESVKERYKKRE